MSTEASTRPARPQTPTIEQMIATRAIEEAFLHYFDRIDANDPEGAVQVMVEDVEFEIMIGKRKRGRDRFARSVGRVLDQYERTSHHLDNLIVRLSGEEADVLAYVYAYHRMRNTGEPWHLWTRMHDQFRLINGCWTITEHVLLGLDAVPNRYDIPRDWYPGHPGRLERTPAA
ncbi:MAG: nuclear transport factor 2 family protein [Solirubrobacteraceae bacterium]